MPKLGPLQLDLQGSAYHDSHFAKAYLILAEPPSAAISLLGLKTRQRTLYSRNPKC